MKTLQELDKMEDRLYKQTMTIGKLILMITYLAFFAMAMALVCHLVS